MPSIVQVFALKVQGAVMILPPVMILPDASPHSFSLKIRAPRRPSTRSSVLCSFMAFLVQQPTAKFIGTAAPGLLKTRQSFCALLGLHLLEPRRYLEETGIHRSRRNGRDFGGHIHQ